MIRNFVGSEGPGVFRKYPEYQATNSPWFNEMPVGWKQARFRHLFRWEKGRIPTNLSEAEIAASQPYLSMAYLRGQEPTPGWVVPGRTDVVARAGEVLLLWDGSNAGEFLRSANGVVSSTAAVVRPIRGPHDSYWFYLCKAFEQTLKDLSIGMGIPHVSGDLLADTVCPLPPYADRRAIAEFLDRETARIDTLVTSLHRVIDLLEEKRQGTITQAATKGLAPNVTMKDSGVPWLGDIPAHWEVVELKRFARSGYKTFTDGDWVETPLITESGVRLIQTGNVGIGEYREKGFRYVSQETFRSLRCTEIRSGDVLICRLDGPVGRACLVPDLRMRMITSVDNAILKPNANVDPRYVVHLLSAPQYLDWVQSVCRVGGGHRFRISRTMLGEFRLPLPPSAEQKRIADWLDQQSSSMLHVREKIWTQIERLREYRQGLICAAVTGQIDVTAEAAA